MKDYCRFAMRSVVALVIVFLVPGTIAAQGLAGMALADALKKGGYVIVLRHASSPPEVPDEKRANPDNTTRERQLDEAGRTGAAAMGRALRELAIPVGIVATSPTYRALETVRLAQLTSPQVVAELGDRGQSMQGVTEADGVWLRKRVTQFAAGTNTILVTHLPNISRAFPQHASDVADGDALIFGADGKGGSTLVGRIKIGEWPGLHSGV